MIPGMTRAGSLLVAACVLVPARAATPQTVVRSFDGDRGPGLATCQSGVTHCDRPEMSAAASGKQVVQVTWQSVRVYDYDGRLLHSTPMADLITKAGLDPKPPKQQGPFEALVVFDEFLERWIITVTGRTDSFLVSASSDAGGAWGGVSLSCLQGGPCLEFDPAAHIGYDKNGVYVCAGHAGDDNPHTLPGYAYDCFALPAAEVREVAAGKPPMHLNRVHNMPLDVVPAIDHNRSKPASAPAFFASKSCARAPRSCQWSENFAFHWVVNTFTWNGAGGAGTWNAAGGPQSVKTEVGSKQDRWLYNTPCCGEMVSIPQRGNETITLRAAESHRLANLAQHGAHLYGVLGSGPCTHDCGAQGADTSNLMFYVDLDCSKPDACVVAETTKIGGAGVHAEFGTLGVDAHGNVGIVATSSTADTNLSLLLWGRRKDDPPGAFSGPTTIVAGTQPYTCLNNRNIVPLANAAGVLTALDPSDGTKLWTTHQYANDAAPCVWNTRIVEYEVGPAGKPR
jgi:hypothetical protein